jgi:hypothetical protein
MTRMLRAVKRIAGTLLLTALGALLIAGTGQAAQGTLTGSVTGAPAEASAAVVEAIDSRGVIGGVGTVSASGAYKLTLAPGAWIVTSSALSGDNTLASFAAPLRIRPGRHTRVHSTTLRPQAVKATARGLRPGSVVTIAPIVINDERGPVFNLKIDYTDLVTNDLFSQCASRQITFVDSSETFRKFAQQELALSRAGRLATPFNYRPIAPQYVIETTFNEVDRGGISFGLSVHKPGDTETDLGAGLVAEGRTQRNGAELESAPTDEEVIAMVNQEAGALAQKMCG